MNFLRTAYKFILGGLRSAHAGVEYELLVTDTERQSSRRLSGPIAHRPCSLEGRLRRCRLLFTHLFTLRRLLFSIASIPILLLIGILLSGIPPSFKDIRLYEQQLPQHNLTEARSEGRKYLRISNSVWGRGLNNVLHESLAMSYIAYVSNRSFVFEDFVWSHVPLPYTLYDFALRPTRIPLNLFVSGPTAGGPMPSTSPRAVHSDFWDVVCPPDRIHTLDTSGAPSVESDGLTLVNWWKEKLEKSPHECLEAEKPVFDMLFFGSERLMPLWPQLKSSPILTRYVWSPIVQAAVSRNFAVLQPPDVRALYEVSRNLTLGGLVAVHLRRGDYQRHCPSLAKGSIPYMGFTSFPELLDKFDPPPGESEKKAYYMEHCLPTVDQVVSRLRDIRAVNPGLRRVYVLTNAWAWWVKSLLNELQKEGWDDLKSTYDLRLDSEQYWASGAVDMAIAEKAQVFVGNGFSSLTANIFMLRMARGIPMSSNRLL